MGFIQCVLCTIFGIIVINILIIRFGLLHSPNIFYSNQLDRISDTSNFDISIVIPTLVLSTVKSVKTISSIGQSFIKEMSCHKDFTVQILVDKHEDISQTPLLLFSQQNCGLEIITSNLSLPNLYSMNRVDKIALVRNYHREINRYRELFFKAVIIFDIDMKRYPNYFEIEKSLYQLIDQKLGYDTFVSFGVMFRPYGYYDSFATILNSNTWLYAVGDRKIKKRYLEEDPLWIRSNDAFGDVTTGVQAEAILNSNNSNNNNNDFFHLNSGFGGMAMYRATVWFSPKCSYKLEDLSENLYERYSNRDDGRPCEHVAFHTCLHQIIPNYKIAINKNLITYWNNPKQALFLWPTLPVPNLKGSDSRIISTIKYFISNHYKVDLCVWRDIKDEIGTNEVSSKLNNVLFLGINQIYQTNCPKESYDILVAWTWPDPPYLDWLIRSINTKMKEHTPSKLIVGLDDDGIALRALQGWCKSVHKCPSSWTIGNMILALNSGKYHGMHINHHFTNLWKLEMYLYRIATLRLGITHSTVETLNKMLPNTHSSILPYVATKLNKTFTTYWERQHVVFVGYKNQANKDSVNWYLDNILPKTNFHFVIVGMVEVPEKYCKCSDGQCMSLHTQVICYGWVNEEQLDRIVRTSLMTVNPVLEPVGIATKVVYAMLRRTPVITTEFDGTFKNFKETGGVYICSSGDITCMVNYMNILGNNYQLWNKFSIEAEIFISNAYPQKAFDDAWKYAIDYSIQAKKSLLLLGDAIKDGWSLPSQNWLILSILVNHFKVSVYGKVVPPIYGVDAYENMPKNSYPKIVLAQSWPPYLDTDLLTICNHACRSILYLPWEFGSLPSKWVDLIKFLYDEVWAPSKFNRNTIIHSGIIKSRTRVAPCIIDCKNDEKNEVIFKGSPIHFTTSSALLPRKGIDILFHAWHNQFCNLKEAQLLIHTSYELGYTDDDITEFIQISKKCSNIKWIRNKWLSSYDHKNIMTNSHIYISSFRAEGFGLPILEAMLKGKQVVVTSGGSANDFINSSIAYIIESSPGVCQSPPCSKDGKSLCVIPPCNGKTCACTSLKDTATWLEPDLRSTIDALKEAYNDLKYNAAPKLKSLTVKRLKNHYCANSKTVEKRWIDMINRASAKEKSRNLHYH